MRFTWLSNSPWSPSGYGQQTRIFAHRLANLGHEVGIIAYYGLEGGIMQLAPNVVVFPKRFHPYGNDIAVAHTRAYGAQFMISLTDVWVLNPEEYPMDYRWIAWYPVDHEPIPGIVRGKLAQAWRRISISKYGAAQTHAAGLDCTYIPHGIETGTLKPGDKRASRERLGLPLDRWIVGTVAMNKGNPSRKNFVEMMRAYAAFHKRHTDTFYFLQTDRGENANDVVNLPELARSLGLEEGRDYGFCNQYQQATGFAPPYFADLYNALDCHMLVSAGEGFGIPTIEAQACGTPVIVGDWTASSELCFAGQLVDKKDAEPWYTPFAAYQYKPRVRAVELALEAEYKRPSPTAKAVERIRREYDADVLVETCWKPFLAEIEEAIHA